MDDIAPSTPDPSARLADVARSVLHEAGEDSDAATVYCWLVEHPGATPAAIAEAVGVPLPTVSGHLDALLRLGLVRRDHEEAEAVAAVAPDWASQLIVAQGEQRLSETAEHLARLRQVTAELRSAYPGVHSRTVDRSSLAQLDSRREVVTFLHEMTSRCTTETLTLVSNKPSAAALANSREQDRALLRRGVAVRGIYLSSARSQPDLVDSLRWLHEEGAEVRLSPIVPVRALIFDRRTAVVAQDPDDLNAGALVVHEPGLLTALLWLFDLCWHQAEPLGVGAEEGELSAVERALLLQFATGAKDAAIARRMDVSVRTVRRTVTQLCERLGVSTRFQLGARAAELGLTRSVPSRPPAAPEAPRQR